MRKTDRRLRTRQIALRVHRSLAILLLLLGIAPHSLAARDKPQPEGEPRGDGSKYPVPREMLDRINAELQRSLIKLTAAIEADPRNAQLYSRRGAVYFLQGEFRQAVADFDREVDLEPGRLPSHWRRGIALYYDGQYEESAEQFGKYHVQDEYGDRENGIWNFLANAERLGIDEARERMLAYHIADRRPVMNDVYDMYAGKKTAEDVLRRIEARRLPATQRHRPLFYAHLYIGWLAVAEKDFDSARRHLHKALRGEWGQSAGGGPGYMWHCGRLSYDLLLKPNEMETGEP